MTSTDPVRQEADSDGTIDVEWNGHTFTIPVVDEWSIETLEAFENGKAVASMRELLGPKQWRTFRKTGARAKELEQLADAIGEAMGFESAGG